MDALKMQEAVIHGVSRYNQWREQLLKNWNAPMEKNNLLAAIAMMPVEMKQAMQLNDPVAYEKMMQYLKGESDGR